MEFLDAAGLYKLTGKRRRDAQLRELVFMGVTHKVRSDGSIAVLASHVQWLFGEAQARLAGRHIEPNWDALGQAAQKGE